MEQLKGSKFCLLEFFEDKPVPTIRLGLSEWIEDVNQDELRMNPTGFLGRQVLVRWPDPDKEDQDMSTWSRHRAKIMLFGDDTGTLLQLANSNPAGMLTAAEASMGAMDPNVSGYVTVGGQGGNFEMSKETRKFRKRKPEYDETINVLSERPKFPAPGPIPIRALNLPPGVAPDAIGLMVSYCQHLKKNMRLIRNSLKSVESATEDLLQGLSLALGAPVEPSALTAGDGLDEEEEPAEKLSRKHKISMSDEEESDEGEPMADFSQDSLKKAIEAIEAGRFTVAKASEKFSVPKRAITAKLQEKVAAASTTRSGKRIAPEAGGTSSGATASASVFTPQEEEWLVSVLKWINSCTIPITREVIRTLIKYYLDKQPEREVAAFQENRPGKRWLNEFIERWHKELKDLIQETKMETEKFSLLLAKLDQLPLNAPAGPQGASGSVSASLAPAIPTTAK